MKNTYKLIFGDRTTFEVEKVRIPAEIAVQATKGWFERNLRFVDPEEHVKYRVGIQLGSQTYLNGEAGPRGK